MVTVTGNIVTVNTVMCNIIMGPSKKIDKVTGNTVTVNLVTSNMVMDNAVTVNMLNGLHGDDYTVTRNTLTCNMVTGNLVTGNMVTANTVTDTMVTAIKTKRRNDLPDRIALYSYIYR